MRTRRRPRPDRRTSRRQDQEPTFHDQLERAAFVIGTLSGLGPEMLRSSWTSSSEGRERPLPQDVGVRDDEAVDDLSRPICDGGRGYFDVPSILPSAPSLVGSLGRTNQKAVWDTHK